MASLHARLGRGLRLPFDSAALPAVVFVVVLVVVGATNSDRFLSSFNIGNVLTQATPLIVIAVGQTFAVASGGLDLSVGSTVGLVTVVAAVLFDPLGIALAALLAIAAGLGVGLVNGLAVAAGLDAFLVTLATLSMAGGATFLVLDKPGGHVPSSFGEIAGYLQGTQIPAALPIAAAIAALAAIVLLRTRIGSHIIGVGGDRNVARLCGVRVERTLVVAYLLSALGATLAGLFLVARARSGDPLIGAPFTLDSLAAVVLGGTLLGGGRATIFGACAGALALGLLSNVLNLTQVSSYYQTPAKGGLVIAAVLLPALAAKALRERRRRRAARAIRAFVDEHGAEPPNVRASAVPGAVTMDPER